MIYDVAIIGGGPAGYTAAERVASKGLKTILFEKNALGGVCLNEGCIPTKTLLYSAKIHDSFKSASKYGVTVEGQPTADLGRIIQRKQKTVRRLVAGIRQKMTAHDVVVETGEATLLGEDATKNIQIKCNEQTFTAKKLILCTGSETMVPPIPGLKDSGYWTSREALENKDLPQSLAVIGGGVIGMEFAAFFNSLGVKVDVIEMVPEILGAMDKELSALLREEYTKRGITFHMEAKVMSVDTGKVLAEKDGEQFTIDAEKILLSTGRVPVLEGLNIESLNLEKQGRGIKVDEHMLTSHPNVYACGDVTGQSLLAHTAIREASVATNHILGVEDKMSYKAIPGVVYTNPEIAGVGETEESLIQKRIEHRVIKLPMAYAGRFIAENEGVNGTFKLIVDANNKMIGCHMLGNPASEIIVIAGIAIENGNTLDEFKRYVFPHPTVGEIIYEALF